MQKLQSDLEALNIKCEDPTLWDNAEQASKILQQRASLAQKLDLFTNINQELQDHIDLINLGESENDHDVVQLAEQELHETAKKIRQLQLETMLDGEADKNDCYLEIHAGAGGTESQDWADMLKRMYYRWIDRRGFKSELIEETIGEEAGIKSTSIKISGEFAYGWLRRETGVHRLVRISPFDSNARRHTSFCSIAIYPHIDDDINIEVADKDLRVDTYRASGAGGQHVNKTDSAVRITHLPTNIVVQCQNDRSQHKNRANAMKMLKSKLYELELQQRDSDRQNSYEDKSDIGWGHQIRSYVLHPYQMVKDLRTQAEKGNAQAVLDGDIDMFLEAALAAQSNSKRD